MNAVKQEYCEAKTSFNVLEYNFKWSIENAENIKTSGKIESPHFYPELNNPWWITLERSKTQAVSDLRLLRVDLTVQRAPIHVKTKADCSISVIAGNVAILPSETISLGCGESKATKHRILVPEEGAFGNISLQINLQLKICKEKSLQRESALKYFRLSDEEFQEVVEKAAVNDLAKLYADSSSSDVSLSVDGETLVAHKAILAARSPVFAKMFQQEMEEATKNVVVVEDVRMSSMKEVVAFMYGRAKRDYDYDTAMEVYYAADKYEIKQLQEICGCILASKLDMTNAYQILQLADRHQDKWLGATVMKFIAYYCDNKETFSEKFHILKRKMKA